MKDTKEKLLQALRGLAANKSIDKITVKEIAEKANVTPQTFYNYFPDKYELIQWAYRVKLDKLIDSLRKHEIDYEGFLRGYLAGYKDNARYIINAATNVRGQNSYSKESAMYFCSCIERGVRMSLGVEETPLEYKLLVEVYVAGFSNLVLHWLSTDEYSMDEIVKALNDAVPQKLRDAFFNKYS